MQAKTRAIAIVGGGFSGAALAIYLLDAGPPDLDIHVFEPRPALGWGIAYGDARACHILNVPADRMSLWSDRPNDFLDWSRRHGARHGYPLAGAAHADTYLPRRLYGHYVEDALQAARRRKMVGGPPMTHHRTSVRTVDRQPAGFVVQTDEGETLPVDAVVLATGFRRPGVPFPIDGTGPGFIADPWQAGALDVIGQHDRVLIAGTGLTMVDAIYALDSAGHRGPVTAISRHGLLPRTHGISSTGAPPADARRRRAGGRLGAPHVARRAGGRPQRVAVRH